MAHSLGKSIEEVTVSGMTIDHQGTGIHILQEKKFAMKIFKFIYLSFFIITKLYLKHEYLLLFKLN